MQHRFNFGKVVPVLNGYPLNIKLLKGNTFEAPLFTIGLQVYMQLIDGTIQECNYCQESAEDPLIYYLLDCDVIRELRDALPDWDESLCSNAPPSLVYALQDKLLPSFVQVIQRYPSSISMVRFASIALC